MSEVESTHGLFRRQPLSEAVKGELRQEIVQGKLPAGEKINVDSVARRMGVSPIPVREALRSLEADGWVRLKQHVGAYVRDRTLNEARDLHQTREILESEIASLAAIQRTDADLTSLQGLVSEGQAAAQAGHTGSFGQINTRFHAQIAAATGNAVLVELHNMLELRVEFYYSTAVSQRIEQSAAEHGEIFQAIRNRDSSAASHLAKEHARATRSALESVFSSLDDEVGGK